MYLMNTKLFNHGVPSKIVPDSNTYGEIIIDNVLKEDIMDINQIKLLKRELEVAVTELCKNFEIQTDTKIENIREHHVGVMGKIKPKLIHVEIKVSKD